MFCYITLHNELTLTTVLSTPGPQLCQQGYGRQACATAKAALKHAQWDKNKHCHATQGTTPSHPTPQKGLWAWHRKVCTTHQSFIHSDYCSSWTWVLLSCIMPALCSCHLVVCVCVCGVGGVCGKVSFPRMHRIWCAYPGQTFICYYKLGGSSNECQLTDSHDILVCHGYMVWYIIFTALIMLVNSF